MHASTRSRFLATLISLIAAVALALPLAAASSPVLTAHAAPAQTHASINCRLSATCTEVQDSEEVFGDGNYIGHDEPSPSFIPTGQARATRWSIP